MSLEPLDPRPERRQFPRLPVEAPVEVLYPGYWNEEKSHRLMGTTRNLSEGGVCFVVNRRIPTREIVLHIDYEGMGAEYALALILEGTPHPNGTWQYRCQIQRTLGAVDLMAVLESFRP